jgi:hypothetical protein
MNATPKYFVRVGEEVRGPYDGAKLRELAEVGVVTTETEAAVARTGPWGTLAEHPERAAIFPERTQLGFKATEFAVINRKVTEAEARPVEVQQMIAAAEVPGKILKLTAGQAAVEPGKAKVEEAPPNEVELMVRAVNEVNAKFAGPPPPPPKRRMSSNLKLVLALAVLGNGVLLAIPFYYGAWEDFWGMLLVRAWFVIYNGGLVATYFVLRRV